MTLKKLLFFTVIAIVLSACAGKNSTVESFWSHNKASNELVVLVSEDTPGSFEINDETYGYQYELFSDYAKHLGLTLKYVDASRLTAKQKAELMNTQVDILTSKLGETDLVDQNKDKLEVYKTEYVVVTRSQTASQIRRQGLSDIVTILKGKDVLLSLGFKETKNYDVLLDSLSSHSSIYLSSRNGFNLIESIGDKEYDFLICEKSEALLGCALTKDVEQIYTFNEKVTITAQVLSSNDKIVSGFSSWLSSYRNSSEYAMLNYMYFEHGIAKQFLPRSGSLAFGRISAYDEMVREISEKQGLDWRFVSAVMYSESRFKPDVVSHKGAKGLMQIMPIVARNFNVAEHEVLVPENNILLGVRLLNKIEATLNFPEHTPDQDKMRIILACYNAGMGHVIDARNLAKKYGKDPNSWAEMSPYLNSKSDYANDEVVRHGRFRGGETMAFVEGVISQYNNYCVAVAR